MGGGNFELGGPGESGGGLPYMLGATIRRRTSHLSATKRVCMTDQTLATPIDDRQQQKRGFSRYQSFLIALLALAQFTIILDFIIMSPLGAILMPALDITAGQFAVAVSGQAFSTGISRGVPSGLPAPFARNGSLCFF